MSEQLSRLQWAAELSASESPRGAGPARAKPSQGHRRGTRQTLNGTNESFRAHARTYDQD